MQDRADTPQSLPQSLPTTGLSASPSPLGRSSLGQSSGQSSGSAVPLSVYRQLAAELQATRAMLESVQFKNAQLDRQNQQLRGEIDRFARSALQLQQAANPILSADWSESQAAARRPAAPADAGPTPFDRAAAELEAWNPLPDLEPGDVASRNWVAEQAQPVQHPERNAAASARPSNGWWLAAALLLIVATAAGMSFAIARSNLTQPQQSR